MRDKIKELREFVTAWNKTVALDMWKVTRATRLYGRSVLFPGMYNSVMDFIFERTAVWGKSLELISRGMVMMGIPGVIKGLGISSCKVNAALKYLEEKNIVTVVRFRSGARTIATAYFLNLAVVLSGYTEMERKKMTKDKRAILEEIERMYAPLKMLRSVAIDCSKPKEEIVATIEDLLLSTKKKSEQAHERRVAMKTKSKALKEDRSIVRKIDGLLEMLDAPKAIWTGKTRGMAMNLVRLDHAGHWDPAVAELEAVFTDWKVLRAKVVDMTKGRIFISRDPCFDDFYRTRKEFREAMRAKKEVPKPVVRKEVKEVAKRESEEEKRKRIQREQDQQFAEEM